MNRSYRNPQIIDAEFRSGAWVPPAVSGAHVVRPSRLGAILRSLLLMLASALVAGAGTLIAFSGVGGAQQQPSSWRPVPPHSAAAMRDAVPAGLEAGLTLYPCRGTLAGGMQLGRYRADFNGCHVGYGGHEAEVAPFEVLAPTWTDGAEGLRRDAMVAGVAFNADPTAPLVPGQVITCRAAFQGGTHPGSLGPREKGCGFGFGGRVIVSENYAVLQTAPWMTWAAAVAGALPAGALIGGEEGGEPFFICRASAPYGLYSGKVKKTSPGCSIPVDTQEMVQSRFEVLVPRWQAAGSGLPVGGFVGGREENNLLFVCRAQIRATMQLGKTNAGLAGCHIGMQDSEIVVQDYDVLAQ